MQIELGPAASRLLTAQARAADMELNQWIEHLAVEHEDAQNSTATEPDDIAETLFIAADGFDTEALVQPGDLSAVLAEEGIEITPSVIGRLLARAGAKRRRMTAGSHYTIGDVREALIRVSHAL